MSDWFEKERESLNGFVPSEAGTPNLADDEHETTDNIAPMMNWSQHVGVGEV